MQAYLSLLQHILDKGQPKTDRTQVGTLSTFGYQMRINLQEGFPLLTTKKVYFQGVVAELLWFLRGDTNLHFLHEHNVHIWDAWADAKGNLGKIYGHQWRSWQGVDGKVYDQIQLLIENLQRDPYSRRHVISAWNVAELDQMHLAPCHALFQFNVQDNRLSCHLYQRSADAFLGVPFNIASYALLTHLVAQVCGLIPHEFIHSFGDLHIYQNHLAQVKTQLQRTPTALPRLVLHPNITNIFDFQMQDITLVDYHPQAAITAPVAI